MAGRGNNGMYLLNMEPLTHALTMCFLSKPTSIEVWHRHLGHAGTRTIMDMAKQGLVNSLDVVGGPEPNRKCEDCIYGKQTTWPYNEVIEPKKEVLEHGYGDLWTSSCSVC